MSIKKSLAYLVYTIFLLGLFIYIGELILDIEAEVSTSAELTPLYYFPLVYFPLGLLLGLPPFIQQFKQSGGWKVNMEKLLFVGIPSLYLCCYPIFYFHAPVLTLPFGKLNLILLSHSFTQIAGIIFGYMLITSFYKVSKYPVIIGR